ncbi:MAG TPA: cytochrome c oxidase subunit II, partial [Tepidiformaceae bacterium]|nr:cytochrome c oxidase subunit II [Tepidiformaceae bacterium]
EPTLVIPVGERVEFALFSPDVIHSFYIRDFLYKLDVVPGRDNRFVVTAHTTGEFFGQCAELCGLDHAFMRFRLRVVTREEFDAWVAEMAPQSEEDAVAAAP